MYFEAFDSGLPKPFPKASTGSLGSINTCLQYLRTVVGWCFYTIISSTVVISLRSTSIKKMLLESGDGAVNIECGAWWQRQHLPTAVPTA